MFWHCAQPMGLSLWVHHANRSLWLWRWLPGSTGVMEGMLRTCPARLNLLLQFSDRFPGPLGPGRLCLRPICAFRQSHDTTDWAWIAAEASLRTHRSVRKSWTNKGSEYHVEGYIGQKVYLLYIPSHSHIYCTHIQTAHWVKMKVLSSIIGDCNNKINHFSVLEQYFLSHRLYFRS